MNDETYAPLDRLDELLADRTLFGLEDGEQRELEALLAGQGGNDIESLDRTAASAQLAMLAASEALPTELAAKLIDQGRLFVSSGIVDQVDIAATEIPQSISTVTKAPTTTDFPRREMLAWFSAAAALLIALFVANRTPQTDNVFSAKAIRTELLTLADKQPDSVTQVSWTLGDDPTSKAASGDVLWHNDRQLGVMRFKNLAANDPTKTQYQLWIFDSAQDEQYPIDGGVFDIPADADEVLIKIDAKLPVVDPTLFAITVENSGGVVVSSRERLPLLAKVE